MRKAIIAGNWKMNKTMAETKAMITELAPLVKDATCDVVLCVPFTDIQTAKRAARGTNIKIGAENVATIGDNELESGICRVKRMSDGVQAEVKIDELSTYFD